MFHILIAAIAVMFWALGTIAVRVVVGSLPLYTMLSSGFGISAGLLLIIAAVRSPNPTVRMGDLPIILVGGLLKVALFATLFANAQLLTSSGRATAMVMATPLILPLFELAILRKIPHWSYGVTLIIGSAGLYALIAPYWQAPPQMEAALFALLACLVWSLCIAIEIARPIEGDPLAAIGWQMMVAALVLVAGAVSNGESVFLNDMLPLYWFWYGVMVFAAMTGANVLLYEMPVRMRPILALTTLTIVPLVVTLLGIPILGERPTLWDWAGVGLLTLATGLSATNSFRKMRKAGTEWMMVRRTGR